MFAGVGGGMTNGRRSASIAAYAEHQGAFGVVCNAFIQNEAIRAIKETVEIPIVFTVVSEHADIQSRLDAGVDFLNVSGAARTPGDRRRDPQAVSGACRSSRRRPDGREHPRDHRRRRQRHHLYPADERRALRRIDGKVPQPLRPAAGGKLIWHVLPQRAQLFGATFLHIKIRAALFVRFARHAVLVDGHKAAVAHGDLPVYHGVVHRPRTPTVPSTEPASKHEPTNSR